MSDRRRRRLNDEGEDEGTPPTNTASSGNSGTTNPSRGERPSECESEDGDVELSESESAADDGTEKEDDTEEGSDTETEGSYTEDVTSDSDTETEGGEEYTDDEGLDGERQSGDGQEQPEDEKPDDDEDRKNPAYVPRKGAFYEHDYRDGIDGGEEKEEPIDENKIKKLWQDEGKWGHDFYRDDQQAPKSREELIALYGYDIRAADKPPEAPPMRRGRGRGRPRGEHKIKDFLPRMAVIDTTEYGTDTVPSLDDDGLITYNDHKPARGGRGRGGNYGRGSDNNSSKYRNRDGPGYDKGDNRYTNAQERETTPTNFNSSQDARSFSDYPSLNESRGMKSNRDYNRDRGNNNSQRGRGRDYPPHQYRSQSSNEEYDQSNSYRNDRNRKITGGNGGRRFEEGGNNYNDSGNSYNNTNNRRGERNSGNDNYQQRHDQHQSQSSWRENNNQRQMESNWRRGEPVSSDGFHQRDNNNRGRQAGGYQGRGGGRGNGDGGSSYTSRVDRDDQYNNSQRKGLPPSPQDDGVAGAPVKRNNRMGYDNVPPRHQQNMVDTREFTSSKVTPGPVRPAPSHNAGDDRGLPMRYNRNVSDTPTSNPGSLMQTGVGNDAVGGGAGGGATSSSNNLVISNKENVQTINVTITTTNTEKKSYAKERRAKGAIAPKAGVDLSQQGPPMMIGPPEAKTDGVGVAPSKHFTPTTLTSGSRDATNLPMMPSIAGKRYSSQRQQQQVVPKASFNAEKPTVRSSVDQGANLYNPALPPPTLFQHDGSSTGTQAQPPAPQDSQQRFNPSILPPANPALSFALPVPAGGLPIPAPTGSPNIFQGPPVSLGAPTPAGPALIAPPFIAPPGMIYATSPSPNPRVPPPATPVAFPIPLAYTAAHPPPPTQPPSNVVPPPVSQGAASSVPGGQSVSSQPKKVYRGDITYYAPELQQPSRTTQKRPKSAIPIVDPQEMRQFKQMEKMQAQEETEKANSTTPSHQPPPSPLSTQSLHQLPPPEGSTTTTTGVTFQTQEAQNKERIATHNQSSSVGSSKGEILQSENIPKPTVSLLDSKVKSEYMEKNISSRDTYSNSSSSITSEQRDEGERNKESSDSVKVVHSSSASDGNVKQVEASHNKIPKVLDSPSDAEFNSSGSFSLSQADLSVRSESSHKVGGAGDADKFVKKEIDVVVDPPKQEQMMQSSGENTVIVKEEAT